MVVQVLYVCLTVLFLTATWATGVLVRQHAAAVIDPKFLVKPAPLVLHIVADIRQGSRAALDIQPDLDRTRDKYRADALEPGQEESAKQA